MSACASFFPGVLLSRSPNIGSSSLPFALWLLLLFAGTLHVSTANNEPIVLNASSSLCDWESHLFRTLLERYVRDARPARKIGLSVNVTVDMMIMKINQLVERDQEIILSGYLKIGWKDERLSWDPSKYSGIEWIVVPSSSIWIPDIGLINSADMYSITRDFRFPAVVDFTGNVIWVPAGKFAARCELDVTYFPFDNQTCFYRFESWSYPIDFLNITGESMVLSPAHYVPDQQWNVTAVSVKTYVVSYEAGLYSFSRIDFVLRLRRKPLYYVTYTILPALALSALQVLSHLLPVADSNRIAFATTTLIAFSVVHVSVSENMPKTSDSVPLIAIYVDVVMGLIATSLIEAFLTANCLEKASGTCPPKWLWMCVVDILGRFVFFRSERVHAKYLELRRLLDDRARVVIRRRQSEHVMGHQSPLSRPRHEHSSLKLKSTTSASTAGWLPNGDLSNGKLRRDFQPQIGNSQEASRLLLSVGQRDSYPPSIQFSSSNNTGFSNYSQSSSTHSNKHGVDCNVCASLLQSLSGVHSDVALLRKLCDDLADRQLRELSREVWNALLSIVDRYVFLVAMSVAILTPAYLFLIFPPPPDVGMTV